LYAPRSLEVLNRVPIALDVCTDMHGMAHTLLNPSVEKTVWGTSDLPPFVPHDRRMTSDRRVEWRGGRRDKDWLCRPLGKLATFEKSHRDPAIWRRVFLGLW